jgi:hypothetical protein
MRRTSTSQGTHRVSAPGPRRRERRSDTLARAPENTGIGPMATRPLCSAVGMWPAVRRVAPASAGQSLAPGGVCFDRRATIARPQSLRSSCSAARCTGPGSSRAVRQTSHPSLSAVQRFHSHRCDFGLLKGVRCFVGRGPEGMGDLEGTRSAYATAVERNWSAGLQHVCPGGRGEPRCPRGGRPRASAGPIGNCSELTLPASTASSPTPSPCRW